MVAQVSIAHRCDTGMLPILERWPIMQTLNRYSISAICVTLAALALSREFFGAAAMLAYAAVITFPIVQHSVDEWLARHAS